MRENGLAHVEGDASEENGEEHYPLSICKKSGDDCLLIKTVSEHRECDIPEAIEDDIDGKIYLE